MRVGRELILSGGPINSPQLLKLSGVGPAAELRTHGIPVIHDLPGVGENLQDHLEFYFQVACKEPITLYSSINLWNRALIGARWLLRKDGLGASNHFETCGFIRSRPGVPYPDIQYHFLPMAVAYDGSTLAQEHGFQAHAGPMRSKSRGWVRLASTNPLDKPRILFNYLSEPDDWTEMRACVRLTREIFAQPAFDRYRGREIQPGAEVQSDEEIDAFIRAKVESAYHPSCSCKMGGPQDPLAVVDPVTRVYGLEGLRVVDSSIMPSVTTGNLNAPTIMLAEKAADHILGRGLAEPEDIACDRGGGVWIANHARNSNSVTELAGYFDGHSTVLRTLSPESGYSGAGMNRPYGVAVDDLGNVWVSNEGNDSLTVFIGAGQTQ